MMMTPARLAELDAVMAKATAGEWRVSNLDGDFYELVADDAGNEYQLNETDAAAIVALHNAYHDLRAHIEWQYAAIAELAGAATYLRDDMIERAKREAWQNDGDIIVEAGAGAWSRFNAALDKIGANQ